MLILRRKPGESISIGDEITVTVVEINGGRVRFRIEAPKNTAIRGTICAYGKLKRIQKPLLKVGGSL